MHTVEINTSVTGSNSPLERSKVRAFTYTRIMGFRMDIVIKLKSYIPNQKDLDWVRDMCAAKKLS